MTTTAAQLGDMGEAIRAGAVPGGFLAGRTVFRFPTLKYSGARDAHEWTVSVRLLCVSRREYVPMAAAMLSAPLPDLAGHRAEITVEARQVGGKVRDAVPTWVSGGKNLGRKNATNMLTQAFRDALGKYNAHLRKVELVPGANEGEGAGEGAGAPVSSLDAMPPPMLVKKAGESRAATLGPADFAAGVTAQRKLNGVRYVAFARDGPDGEPELVAYSRTGVRYPGQKQVVSEVLRMLLVAPPLAPPAPDALSDPGVLDGGRYGSQPYLDGELFLEGRPLQWISGQARKDGDEGLLEYHVFDVFWPRAAAAGFDVPSRERQAYLDSLFAAADRAGLPHPHVRRVANFPARSPDELDALARQFIREGYEGLIARKDAGTYEYGYSNRHSASLVKVKPRPDAEFNVVGYAQGVKGKDVGAVIWECEVSPADPDPKAELVPRRTFTVVPSMPLADRKTLFRCLAQRVPKPGGGTATRFERDFMGRPLTIEYAELSVDGVPLQPKATVFRSYESGAEDDPVRRALAECGLLGAAAKPARATRGGKKAEAEPEAEPEAEAEPELDAFESF